MNCRTLALIFSFFVFGCSPSGDSTPERRTSEKFARPKSSSKTVSDLLPLGETQAMLLEYQLPQQITLLAEQMEASISTHSDWIQQYVKDHSHLARGEVLPYHENFGITAEEYHWLNEALDRTTLTPSVPCVMSVELEKDGLFMISVQGEDFYMNGLMIDTNTMSASFGAVTATDSVESESPIGAKFRVDGIRWKTELPNPTPEHVETLFVRIGSNLNNGNRILMYRVLHVENGEILAQGELNIEWPPDQH